MKPRNHFDNFRLLLKRTNGVTSIEYALIAFLIAIAIIVSVGATGDQVEALYNSVAQHFTA